MCIYVRQTSILGNPFLHITIKVNKVIYKYSSLKSVADCFKKQSARHVASIPFESQLPKPHVQSIKGSRTCSPQQHPLQPRRWTRGTEMVFSWSCSSDCFFYPMTVPCLLSRSSSCPWEGAWAENPTSWAIVWV